VTDWAATYSPIPQPRHRQPIGLRIHRGSHGRDGMEVRLEVTLNAQEISVGRPFRFCVLEGWASPFGLHLRKTLAPPPIGVTLRMKACLSSILWRFSALRIRDRVALRQLIYECTWCCFGLIPTCLSGVNFAYPWLGVPGHGYVTVACAEHCTVCVRPDMDNLNQKLQLHNNYLRNAAIALSPAVGSQLRVCRQAGSNGRSGLLELLRIPVTR